MAYARCKIDIERKQVIDEQILLGDRPSASSLTQWKKLKEAFHDSLDSTLCSFAKKQSRGGSEWSHHALFEAQVHDAL